MVEATTQLGHGEDKEERKIIVSTQANTFRFVTVHFSITKQLNLFYA
jgi:hypothetical protein